MLNYSVAHWRYCIWKSTIWQSYSVSLREVSCQCIFKEYFWVLPLGIDWGPNHFGFLNNLVNLKICESLKEIGEMACVTSAWSSRGRTLKSQLNKTTRQRTKRMKWQEIQIMLLSRTIVWKRWSFDFITESFLSNNWRLMIRWLNSPFPCCSYPPFQTVAKCKTIHFLFPNCPW